VLGFRVFVHQRNGGVEKFEFLVISLCGKILTSASVHVIVESTQQSTGHHPDFYNYKSVANCSSEDKNLTLKVLS
jgi:hypothetical protein